MFHLIVSVKTCAKVNADHASADPDQTDYDYNTDVTYSCDLAYNHTAGNLTRTCNASAEWTGTLPTCESKTTLMCLNYGTPKYYLFSICNKWKINFFRCPDSLYQHGKWMVLYIFRCLDSLYQHGKWMVLYIYLGVPIAFTNMENGWFMYI